MAVTQSFVDPIHDQSDAFLQDPHAALAQLRSINPVLWSPKGRHWLVTGHDEAVKILRSKTAHKRMAPM